MNESGGSKQSRFSDGEDADGPRKKKTNQTIEEKNKKKCNKEKNKKILFQTYKSSQVAMCATTTTNNVMQHTVSVVKTLFASPIWVILQLLTSGNRW